MRLINKLLKKRFLLKKIKKSDLILLDNNFANLKFKNIHFHIFDPDKYYIWEFLVSFYKYLTTLFSESFSFIYFKTLIEKIEPKVALGHEMNHHIFNFKKLFPDKISACYQYGYIFKKDINDYYKKNFKGKKLDLFFVYDSRSMKIMKKFIKSKYFINGSTKVNEHMPANKKKKVYDLVFISRLRFPKKKNWNNYDNQYDKFLIKIIDKYCNINNLSLTIAFNSLRKDKKDKQDYFVKEKNFYNSAIKNYNIGREDSLSLSHKSKLVICNNSNHGFELLLSKCKVVFIDSTKTDYKYFIEKKGPFWYYGNDKKQIFLLIDKVYKKSNRAWQKDVIKSNKNLEPFYKKNELYYNNYILKKKIEKFIN